MRADRFSIIPATAFFVLLVWTIPEIVSRAADQTQQSSQIDALKTAPATGNPTRSSSALPFVKVIDASPAQGILGRSVEDAAGQNMGRIVDVLVDPAGHVLAAVIDFGGFLGVGSRKIAVDWAALRFGKAVKHGDEVRLQLTKDQIKAAPEYKEGKPLIVIGASGNLEPMNLPEKATREK
jgi:PRC-barrel domain